MPRGGKRAGAGKPKGYKHQTTLEREEARKRLRERVIAEMEPLLSAQIANAKGISHFFLRHPRTKQFQRIEDPQQIAAALNRGEEGKSYWIFTKDPSIQAFTDLMNRTFDKPKEHVEVTGADGGPVMYQWKES
jgi:hypothetical protein